MHGSRRDFLEKSILGILSVSWASLLPTPLLAQSPAPELLFGRWKHSGGASDQQRRKKAIDTIADAMPFGFRDMTRDRILETNPLEPWVYLRQEETLVIVEYPDTQPMRALRDGTVSTWTNREQVQVKLTHRLSDTLLVQVTINKKGRRRTSFRLDSSKQKLLIDTHVQSKYLPGPVQYRSHYRRA